MPKASVSFLYGLTLFVSAFLLFWVEPLLGKLLLPVFGGAPAVWNVCLIFFQAALLGGYIYAHGIARRVPFRPAAILHVCLLLAATLFLPVSLHEAVSMQARSQAAPAWEILRVLVLCIGLPFLLLSATSSLLQSWLSGSSHARAEDPTYLYAVSNLGSLLALLLYPWLIEPSLAIDTQWRLWKQGCLALALLLGLCAIWRDQKALPEPLGAKNGIAGIAPTRALRWMLWSFVPSSLLLGVTSYLSTDIIAVPLLWTIPLVIYLGSFAWVFARPKHVEWVSRRSFVRVLGVGTTLCLLGIVIGFNHPPAVFLPLQLLVFAIACLVCLGQVAADRPAAGELTRYYLFIAVGGVLGAVFNGIVAPLIFSEISEYPLAMILACLCRPRGREWRSELPGKGDLLVPALCAMLIFSSYRLTQYFGLQSWIGIRLIVVGPAALLCYLTINRPWRFGLGLGVLYFVGAAVLAGQGQDLLFRQRTFFGTLKVLSKPEDKLVYLIHGSTSHGAQSTDPARKGEPLTYYSRQGPAGQIFEELYRKKAPMQIGVIGLGAGTLAAYARAEDRWTFFELDPGVVSIARDPAYFTYLKNSAAASSTSVIVGDARLRIHEVADGSFSLLVVDAFSSDSVPAHLMTREALALYLSKLAPGGFAAFHVSNRFLRLAPVVGAVANELGAVARVRGDVHGFGAATGRVGESPSIWVVVARKESDLGSISRDKRWQALPPNPRFAWTDDFYDLIGLIKW